MVKTVSVRSWWSNMGSGEVYSCTPNNPNLASLVGKHAHVRPRQGQANGSPIIGKSGCWVAGLPSVHVVPRHAQPCWPA